jgi:hypothetical protein
MKRMLFLLALLFVWGHANPLFCQETAENELELVRQLRAKGWHDFARTKIDEMLKRGDPLLNAALPLESARVNIAEARQKDPEQRFALFTTAHKQLQEFIDKNKGKAEAALARVELARLTSYHAQAILSKAMREEDPPSRHKQARPAETKFIEAGKDLEAAIAALEAALKNTPKGDLQTLLAKELKQAHFDVAINIFDQGKTYLDKGKDAVNAQRSLTIDKARKAFTELRKDESSQVGWLANAWLMKCSMELTDGKVKDYHDLVMKRRDDKSAQPGIQPAVRLVRYFALQDLTLPREDTESIGQNALNVNSKVKMSPMQRLKAVQTQAEDWLKSYPNHHKTYEGEGVLFELGYAFFSEALYEEKDKKNAGPSYDKAVVYFDRLAETDGDLAERARQISMVIKFKRLDLKAELKTFDEYMMKAMLDRQAVIVASTKLDEYALKAKEVGPNEAEKKKLDAERKGHLKAVITSLGKALALATERTSPKKKDDARYYLCGAYLAYGDPYRGAIVAEALGRDRATPRAPEGASTALATYSALQSRNPNDAVITQRLHALAEFVLSPENQRTWGAEAVTSLAHYHLAMSDNRENKPKEAIAHLAKIDPDFPDYNYAQGQLLFIAEAAREKLGDNKKEQKFYLDAAKAAGKRMRKLNPDTDSPSVLVMYFYAKLQLSKYLYSEAIADLNAGEGLKAVKGCNDLRQYVRALHAEFDALPGKAISLENRGQLEFTMRIMLKYADLGIAEVRFRSDSKDRFDQVIEATKDVVKGVLDQGGKKPGEPIRMKDYQVTGDILGLALRANVQKGDIIKGKAILDVLQRLSGDKDDQKAGNVVGALLNDISGQIKGMKDANDPALLKTKDNYTAFLDVIAKEYEKNPKGYDRTAAILLAHAYASLDIPRKAADMFSKVKAPASIDKKIEKKNVESDDELKARQAWEEENGRHWGVQIELIRALRACKDKESTKEAEKVIDALLKNPNANFKLHASMEKNFILEDQEQYRAAYGEWQKILGNPSLKDRGNKDVQKIWFPAYFHMIRTYYRTGIHDKAIKDPAKAVTSAANKLVNLEFSKTKVGWEIVGPMFQEFLKEKDADKLKKEYDRLKALRQKGALLAPRHPHAFSRSPSASAVLRLTTELTLPALARGERLNTLRML